MHEGVAISGTVGYLRAPIEQIPFRDIQHYLEKMQRYSSLMARRMYRNGRRFSVFKLLFHPLGAFVKRYVLRRGFADGLQGLLLAFFYAYYTFIKYAKLWECEENHRRNEHPKGSP